ncbi:pyridoxal phosphate-dependent aminotransferase [Leptospira kanakyensis]|uniref:Aminotransferase n=1 Tax=Leptospira kanakyensis TaxID=2484968 RepID=A0A6N4PW90_9LEPT|nr:pyridoxal phosphate-dependent aminotransferase [Leptospira kanakyensis]MCW7482508.1 pyridoxal phosphate-dependent aminotransferase [Leptospira kanakyensis]TGK49396.1 pyridoxal phosphate-dependent aminotransferase [Leptospira kanakyensis]TGK60364.1 pyridoxal phosphate-dependent aminotransferase [Leptospira kanakyensis]TGK67763.1 pyridoxal phosphate-dependent aminotransferase [Leptospira kanakyensis]
MEPREFFIEDRLERFRLKAFCNLGESGLGFFRLEEVLGMAEISFSDLLDLPMNDSPNQGSLELRKAIASLYPGVSPDQVLVTTGTGEALYLAFHIALKPQNKVALIWPAFQALYEIPKMLGAEIVKVPHEKAFLASTWKDIDADLYILNHPHNPTGKTFSDWEWETLIAEFRQKKKQVLFDEHYRFLPSEGFMGRTGVDPNHSFYGTGSFTKCFGVTGLRVGWLIAEESFLKRTRSFKDYLTHTVSPISERIALGLLNAKESFLPKIQLRVRKNIQSFDSIWKELPHTESFTTPAGGLVGWLKLKPGISSEDYADRLFEKTGVFVLPGSNFEEEGFLRIGFGEREERMIEGLLRWKKCTDLI